MLYELCFSRYVLSCDIDFGTRALQNNVLTLSFHHHSSLEKRTFIVCGAHTLFVVDNPIFLPFSFFTSFFPFYFSFSHFLIIFPIEAPRRISAVFADSWAMQFYLQKEKLNEKWRGKKSEKKLERETAITCKILSSAVKGMQDSPLFSCFSKKCIVFHILSDFFFPFFIFCVFSLKMGYISQFSISFANLWEGFIIHFCTSSGPFLIVSALAFFVLHHFWASRFSTLQTPLEPFEILISFSHSFPSFLSPFSLFPTLFSQPLCTILQSCKTVVYLLLSFIGLRCLRTSAALSSSSPFPYGWSFERFNHIQSPRHLQIKSCLLFKLSMALRL